MCIVRQRMMKKICYSLTKTCRRLSSSLFRISDIMKSASGQSSASSTKDSSTDTKAMMERHSPGPSISSGILSSSSPIGYIRSCFKSKNGTPRQPSVCSYARAKLKILKSVFVCPDHSLDGLAQFSHVWILFVFHENGPQSFTKAKVKPPRLDGKKVGVFASRSPHRPNPIGLTLARLDKVEGDTLYLSGMDMIDGTPVLDIKPYVTDYDDPKRSSTRAASLLQKRIRMDEHLDGTQSGSDEVQDTGDGTATDEVNRHSIRTDQQEHVSKDKGSSCYSLNKGADVHMSEPKSNAKDRTSVSKTDTSDDSNRTSPCKSSDASANDRLQPEDIGGDEVRVADWVGAPPIKKLTVRFTPSAEAQLATFWDNPDKGHKLEFLHNYDEAHRAIEDILSADPRSVYRRNSCSDRLYYFTLDNLHITSWFGAGFAEVLQVQPITSADIPKHTTNKGLAPSKVNK